MTSILQQLRPSIVTAKSRIELNTKISDEGRMKMSTLLGCQQSLKNVYGSFLRNGTTIRLFNIRKVRPKKIQNSTKTYQGTGGTVRETTFESRGYWAAYVYDIPVSVIESGNIRFYQDIKNLKIIDDDGSKISIRKFKQNMKKGY